MSGRSPDAALATLALATVAVVAPAIQGCVSIGSSTFADIVPAHQPKMKVLAPDWHAALVLGNARSYDPYEGSSPAADPEAGRIYVGSSSGRFYALRSQDGKRIWSFDSGEAIHGSPVLSEERDVVFFGNEAGRMFALAAGTGKEIWRYEATAEIRCRPLLHEKMLFFRDVRGKVHAVDSREGSALWLYRTDPPEGFVIGSSAGVGLASGRVMAGFTDGMARGLKLLDGSLAWEADLSEFTPEDSAHGTQKTDVNATPLVIDPGTVVFASFKGGLFALDPATGSILWRRSDITMASGMALQDDVIYVARSGKGIAALDVEGSRIWESEFTCGTLSDPIVEDGRIYVSDSKSGLVVVDAATGTVLDRFGPMWGASSQPLVRAGRAVLFSNGGHVWAFHVINPYE